MNDNKFWEGKYCPLSKEQVKTIHETALTILEQIGLTYESGLDEMLDLIEKKGVEVDRENSSIKFQRELVSKAIASAPEHVTLYSRDKSCDINLNQNQVHFATGGTVTNVLDLNTGVCRPSTIKDLYQIARLADHLENIDLIIRPLTPNDIPLAVYDVNIVYAVLKGSRKHFNTGLFSHESFYNILDIASTVSGSLERLKEKPIISFNTPFITSPLKLDTEPTRIMVEAAKNNIPVTISTAPMAGSTSPVTLAGTLTQIHAEVLSGVVITQLINPGAPIIYCGVPTRADMRTMNFLAGTVESAMMATAVHQLAQQVKLPSFASAGWTSSKIIDAQAGWESAMALFVTAMGGINVVRHAAGVMDSGMTISYEQYIINDEIIGMARRLLKGIEVNEDSIAFEAIKDAGPGGQFITSEHTYKHMRSEFFYGNGVTDGNSRENWKEKGSHDAFTRANNMVKEILTKSENSYISSDADRVIREKYDIRL